jgi:hypothetical protein
MSGELFACVEDVTNSRILSGRSFLYRLPQSLSEPDPAFATERFLIPGMKVVTIVRGAFQCGTAFFERQADQSSLF